MSQYFDLDFDSLIDDAIKDACAQVVRSMPGMCFPQKEEAERWGTAFVERARQRGVRVEVDYISQPFSGSWPSGYTPVVRVYTDERTDALSSRL